MLSLEGIDEEVGVALDQSLAIALDKPINLLYPSVSTIVVDPSEQSGMQGIACGLRVIAAGGVIAGAEAERTEYVLEYVLSHIDTY